MKFDVVVGNPPFQDGSKEGGQNKIYNLFAKSALEIGNVVAFVTPTSVLKKSKRFSLVGMVGLNVVDFTANNKFDVGVSVCYWIVDKSHDGDVTVIDESGVRKESSDTVIYDYSAVDINFIKTYEKLKSLTDTPSKRMFCQNAVDASNGRSKQKNKEFKYPVYKLVDGKPMLIQYNKPSPKFTGETKISISVTKALTDSAVYYGREDFDVGHLHTTASREEASNIKSFILSPYFIEHTNRWKQVDGYGFNNALKHLPPFDKTKPWTNDEVKEFIESFLDE